MWCHVYWQGPRPFIWTLSFMLPVQNVICISLHMLHILFLTLFDLITNNMRWELQISRLFIHYFPPDLLFQLTQINKPSALCSLTPSLWWTKFGLSNQNSHPPHAIYQLLSTYINGVPLEHFLQDLCDNITIKLNMNSSGTNMDDPHNVKLI
jgi:hypothetical protein